jgi:hypothetical protein
MATTIPEHILLTGANGFAGSHILDQLLLKGHSVRAIVRSHTNSSQVLADFSTFGSRLDFGIVPNITSPIAFDPLLRSMWLFIQPSRFCEVTAFNHSSSMNTCTDTCVIVLWR